MTTLLRLLDGAIVPGCAAKTSTNHHQSQWVEPNYFQKFVCTGQTQAPKQDATRCELCQPIAVVSTHQNHQSFITNTVLVVLLQVLYWAVPTTHV